MNLNALSRITAHNQTALREGLKIVRKVVASNSYPAGFTTAELFKLVSKESPPADFKALKLPHRPVSAKNAIKRVPVPSPPRPNHPIKSMTFLKKSVLPILEGNKELEIVRTTRIPFNPASVTPRGANKRKNKQEASHAAKAAAPAPVTVWVWKPVDRSKLPGPPRPKPPRKIFGVEVGVGADWSHLSKRRKRTRMGKVRRDVSAMKVAQLVRKQKVRARAAMIRSAAVAVEATVADKGVLRKSETKGTLQKRLEVVAKDHPSVTTISQSPLS